MTYYEALAYLKTLNPMGIRLGLGPIRALLARLGNPEDGYPSVLIAGTNGKGSVAAITSAILTAAGFRTGLFTSPDLMDFRERIRVDGRMIRREEAAACTEEVKQGVRETLSYFEFITAMAFLYFKKQNLDIAVLEVGMGGRLDATNVVVPLVSAITNISREHQQYLGNTLAKITREKGGIIKEGVNCITAARQKTVVETLDAICRERHAILYRVGREINGAIHRDGTFSYRGIRQSYRRLICPLAGRHQIANAVLSLGIAELIGDAGFNVDETAVSKGMKNVEWEGRFEILQDSPTLLVDGAHNAAGVQALRRALGDNFPDRRLTLIFGVLEDKDYLAMAKHLFPLAERIILTRPNSDRALHPDILRSIAVKLHDRIEVVEDPRSALRQAISTVGKNDLVCVAGSLYLVGEIKKFHKILKCGDTGSMSERHRT